MLGRKLQRLKERRGLAIAVVAALIGVTVVGGGQLATAAPSTATTPTSACINKYTGIIRVIVGYPSTGCTFYEYPIDLGAGPTGPTGPAGPTGPTGATGPGGGYYTVSDQIVDEASVLASVTVSCNGTDLGVYAESSSGNPARQDFNTFELNGAAGATLTVYCIPDGDN